MLSERPWQGLGYDDTKMLINGNAAGLQRLLFAGRIVVGNPEDRFGYREAYDFEDFGAAVLAFREWDGDGEPGGWVKHTPSHRRRPGGDPAQEYVGP